MGKVKVVIESISEPLITKIPGNKWTYRRVQMRGVDNKELYHMNFEDIKDESVHGRRMSGLRKIIVIGNKIEAETINSNPHIISQYKEITLVR